MDLQCNLVQHSSFSEDKFNYPPQFIFLAFRSIAVQVFLVKADVSS